MSDHHLGTGSKDVPLTPGKLRLYSMRFCPYSQRTHLVLDAKKIPYDVVWINLKQKPEWYAEKYPKRGVPVLQVDGQPPLYESLIICDYLDEAFGPDRLHSDDLMRKAQDRVLVESFAKVTSPYYKCAMGELKEELFDECLAALEPFEKELATRNTTFFSGSTRPGMADYMIWPWMERFEIFQIRGGDRFTLPKGKFERLRSWTDKMIADEAVKKNYFTPEKHEQFFNLYKAGDTNCADVVKM